MDAFDGMRVRMKRSTVKMLCMFIPVSSWRKRARKQLVYKYALSDEERAVIQTGKTLYAHVMGLIGEESVCIDCGANVGQETVPWAEKGAEVFAFEPHPECFRVLKEKTEKFPKVRLYEQGVWHKNSRMNLYFRDGSTDVSVSESSSLLKGKPNVDDGFSVEVEIIDLIQFIRTMDRKVDVLKIDIEGAEVELVQRILDEKVYEDVGLTVVETHEQIPEIRDDILRLRKLIQEQGITNVSLDWR